MSNTMPRIDEFEGLGEFFQRNVAGARRRADDYALPSIEFPVISAAPPSHFTRSNAPESLLGSSPCPAPCRPEDSELSREYVNGVCKRKLERLQCM